MKKFTLREIAALMHATAERIGQSHRTLGRGLQLNLYRSITLDGPLWTLVLSRADVPPSEQEIATVRRDFGVPRQAALAHPAETAVSLAWLETTTMQVEQHSLLGETA